MCLILFAVRPTAELPLVVAANRDEFYARPALPAHYWEDHPQVLAGRDLEASGTWLGVTRQGRFAAVTNFAEPGDDAPLSRGALTADFLTSDVSASAYAHHLDRPRYRGFNLLLWDGTEMIYTSNKAPTRALPPGYYGLSNAELGASWPKAVRGKAALQEQVQRGVSSAALINLLQSEYIAPDKELPHRGRPIELERRIAPCFIRGDEYGTRASTAVIFNGANAAFSEQLYGPQGTPNGRQDLTFAFSGKLSSSSER